MTPSKAAALTFVMLLACGAVARAQQAACTAAPEPPARVDAKVDGAVKATSKASFTPAVLNLKWQAPRADRDRPGNASSAYVIEAGSDRGLSDVAAVQTAGPELAFTTPMANGTYYLRVRAVNGCGVSRPSKESRVRIKGSVEPEQPNPFVILSTVHATRERLGDRAYVRVLGQVRNGWKAAPASFVTVTASFEGSAGELGVTQTTYVNGTSRRLKFSRLVTDTVIEPGATGCYLIFAEFPVGQVTSLGLVASSEDFASEPLEGRVELDGPMTLNPDQFDGLLVSGRMKNAGDRATRFNEIWVEARDTEGQVLDCRAASVRGSNLTMDDGLMTATELPVGRGGDFENETEAVFSMARTIRQWITWDEADDQRAPVPTPQYRALAKRLIALLAGDAQATSPQEVAQARDALRGEARSVEQRLAAAARR